VNKKAYARLDMIGKGGSSRVYRVLNNANQMFAIKRVSLDKTDAETMSGYMNEIALLKRLEGNNRIIRLIDSEVRPGPDGSKGHLMLVMELGEIGMIHPHFLQRKYDYRQPYRFGSPAARTTEGTDKYDLDCVLLATGDAPCFFGEKGG
jgi:serine/threonine protein kinase